MIKFMRRISSVLAAFSMVAGLVFAPAAVKADALRVVTLGADLSDAQKQTMLKYFKVNADEVRIIYVTNQDERNHLGSYVPLEQIGTRTVSCAYVRPTTSGGIKVRTANLNWVTGNMIATSLSTSGVTNCEVIAACPFEVSGTGALTGVLMAYEVASGTSLDATKKEIATQEMITTANLAAEVGQDQAVNVVNKAKTEVIANNIQNADEIYNTVTNIVNQNGIVISSEEIDRIVELLEEIAAQDYDYEAMEDTLAMIDLNVAGVAEDDFDDVDFDDPMFDEDDDEDSIIKDVDESVLGDDVITSSTAFEDSETYAELVGADVAKEEDDDDWEFFENEDGDLLIMDSADEDQSDDTFTLEQEETDLLDDDAIFEKEEDDLLDEDLPEEDLVVSDMEDDLDLDEWDVSFLSDAGQERFEKAKLFCEGEFEGNEDSLEKALGWAATPEVELSGSTGKDLSHVVLKKYLSILGNGAAYTPSATDPYVSAELNAIHSALQKIFGVGGVKQDKDAAKILKKVSDDDAKTLYDDTMSFFEDLYGETAMEEVDLVETDSDDEGDWQEYNLDEEDDDETIYEDYEEEEDEEIWD